MKRILISLALLAAACTNTTGDEEPTTTVPPTTAAATTTTTTTVAPTTTASPVTTTTTTLPPGPELVPQITVVGPEELMFDWTTDQCEPEHIPDIAARALRDAEGRVQLIIGHYVNYRMIGPDLDTLVSDCSGPMLISDYDPDPAQFNDSEWIGSTYTFDGETVYAVMHNEYRGDTHNASRPGQCPSQDRLTCLDTSLTMAISTDGGDTYSDIAPAPQHLIATLPYTFNDEGVPSGLRQPSNIIEGPDGFYYLFSNISDYPREDQWVCAMRTPNLDDPSAWRYWDGDSFHGVLANPYEETVDTDQDKCAPLDLGDLTGGIQETVVFDEVLQRYVMMGVTFHPSAPTPQFGVYYSLSENLIEWGPRELLMELPVTPTVASFDDLYYAYLSILDPDSTSMNFETTDGEAYLYMTRLNKGGNSLDRDLVRWPIRMEYVPPEEIEPPEWEFESTTGDWAAEHGLTTLSVVDGNLVMESTVDDPYFAVYGLEIPATNDRVWIRMKVSGDGGTVTGQLFFGTVASPAHTEEGSKLFRVTTDGEYHDYELNMSSVSAWDGTVTSLRLDPAPDAGRTIEIDRIWLTQG